MAKSRTDLDLICVGALAGARGVRGEVRIKSFTAKAANLADYGPLYDQQGDRVFDIRITGSATGKAVGTVFARLRGVDDRDAAEALKGTRLYVPRSALPEPAEDEFYHADLVGLRADLVDGGTLGTIRAVQDFGAGPVLEIAGGEAGLVIVPFTRAVAPVVDLVNGRVVIDPPPGLLDGPKGQDNGADNDRT